MPGLGRFGKRGLRCQQLWWQQAPRGQPLLAPACSTSVARSPSVERAVGCSPQACMPPAKKSILTYTRRPSRNTSPSTGSGAAASCLASVTFVLPSFSRNLAQTYICRCADAFASNAGELRTATPVRFSLTPFPGVASPAAEICQAPGTPGNTEIASTCLALFVFQTCVRVAARAGAKQVLKVQRGLMQEVKTKPYTPCRIEKTLAKSKQKHPRAGTGGEA